jgi:YegS/Rv2252/BmrU family lipid kinase
LTTLNLVILNPHARGGQAGRTWPKLEPILRAHFDDLIIAITENTDAVADHIDEARKVGIERILIIGGDGTNHSIINALLNAPGVPDQPSIAIGQVPIGTGRDWARTIGTPIDPEQAIRWLAEARPHPCDVGRVHLGDKHRLFLNITSAGVGSDIDRRVNAVENRRPWTFLRAILTSLAIYKPPTVRVDLDGEPFYEGNAYIVAVCNGQWFGHGIWAAPQAAFDDGLFDVIIVEGISRIQVVRTLMKAYKGRHLDYPGVHYQKAARVDVVPLSADHIGLDLDGEPGQGTQPTFELLRHAVHVLVKPPAV